jgi:hypothetical protein
MQDQDGDEMIVHVMYFKQVKSRIAPPPPCGAPWGRIGDPAVLSQLEESEMGASYSVIRLLLHQHNQAPSLEPSPSVPASLPAAEKAIVP